MLLYVVQCQSYTKPLRDDRCGFKDVGGNCGQSAVSEKNMFVLHLNKSSIHRAEVIHLLAGKRGNFIYK